MIVGSAEVELRPDSSRFGRTAERDLSSGMDRAGRSSGRAFATKFAAAAATGFAALKAGAFFKDVISGASDLEESTTKVGVVFGDAAASVMSFADSSATAFGQSKAQALEATGTFGNLLRSVGLNEREAAKFSTSMTGLASDLASFNNTTVDDALLALRSGLVGETEPLKRFGVNLDEATLKAKALELGLGDGKATLDANAKAQAAYALIMEQTSLAQGDFARTSGGLANQQRILAARWEDLKARLGTALLPAVTAVITALNNGLFPAFEQLQDVAGPAVAVIAAAAQVLFAAFTGRGTEATDRLGSFGETLVRIGETARAVYDGMALAAQGLYDLLVRGDFSSAFAQAFAISEDSPVVDLLLGLRDTVITVAGVIRQNIGPIVAGLAALALPSLIAGIGSLAATIGGVLAAALSPLGLLLSPLFILGVALAQVVRESKPLRDAIAGIADAFREGGIAGAIEQIGVAISLALPLIAAKLAEWGQALVDWVLPRIPPLLAALGQLALSILTWLGGTALPAIAQQLAQWGAQLVAWIGPQIGPALSALGGWLASLGQWIIGTGLPALGAQLARLGQALVSWIGPRIGPALAAVGTFLGRLVAWVVGTGFPRLLKTMGQLGLALITWVGPRIPGVLAALGQFIAAGVNWVFTVGLPKLQKALLDLGIAAVKGLVNGLKQTDLGKALTDLKNRVINGLKGAKDWLLQTGKDVVQGLIDGIQDMAGAVIQKAQDLADKVTGPFKAVLGIFSPSRVFRQFGKYIGDGLILGLTGSQDKIRSTVQGLAKAVSETFTDLGDTRRTLTRRIEDLTDRLRGLDRASRTYARDRRRIVEDLRAAESQLTAANRFTAGTRDALTDRIRTVNARLLPLVRDRDRISASLKAATDRLNDAVKVRADFASGLTEQLRGAFGIVANDGIVTAGRIEKQMRDRLGALTRFQAQLATLVKRGLSPELIRQIATSGVEAGTATVAALANASADEIKRINGLQTQVEKVTASTSNLVADRLYNAGIASARGLVDGLAREQKRIEAQMLKIAKSMETAIKRALGIRSPSTLFRDIGRQTMAGLDQGVDTGSAGPIARMSQVSRDLAAALDVGALAPAAAGAGPAGGGRSMTVQLATRVSAGEVVPLLRQYEVLQDALYGTG